MSHVYNELIELNVSALKLRESIHKNQIYEKATNEQEDAFYKMLNVLLTRTKEYVDKNKGMSHIDELVDFYKKAVAYTYDELTFNCDELKKLLDQYYEEERKTDDGNFVAAADMLVLYPLRMMIERMHRTLTGQKYDERFDGLFHETDRY